MAMWNLSRENKVSLTLETQGNTSYSQNKSENYMIISIDMIKVFDNIQHPFTFLKNLLAN